MLGDKKRILIADDEAWVLDLLESILKPYNYDLIKAKDGDEALSKAYKEKPDLIILDIKMPGKDGLTVCKELKSQKEFHFIPIIILTALEDEKIKAFNIGADDFLVKPFSQAELHARINSHLRLKGYVENLEDAELLLYTMAKIIEVRDAHTEEHISRVTKIAVKIAEEFDFSETDSENLRKGGNLHDIGKVGIPDRILLKPGKLTEEEFEIVKKHVVIGEEICRPLSSLKGALPIIRHHHERWDGKGYPDGLTKDEIPLNARIVAVADAFDAMTHNRPYRKAIPYKQTIEILKKGKNKQWDGEIVDILISLAEHNDILS